MSKFDMRVLLMQNKMLLQTLEAVKEELLAGDSQEALVFINEALEKLEE